MLLDQHMVKQRRAMRSHCRELSWVEPMMPEFEARQVEFFLYISTAHRHASGCGLLRSADAFWPLPDGKIGKRTKRPHRPLPVAAGSVYSSHTNISAVN